MRKSYPSDLTNADWELIEPLLPTESTIGHPRDVRLREIVNAIFYVQREGCTWRALPGDFPAWQTVYGYLRLWQKLGIWQQVHDALRAQLRQAVGKKPQATAGIIESDLYSAFCAVCSLLPCATFYALVARTTQRGSPWRDGNSRETTSISLKRLVGLSSSVPAYCMAWPTISHRSSSSILSHLPITLVAVMPA